jgi:hypothetical protein
VTSEGHAVIGLDARGPMIGAALFEPVPYGGGAAKRLPLVAGVAAGPRPLDRARFLDALGRGVAEQRLAIGGALRERPAGGFSWRKQEVARHGLAPADGVGAAGRDTSGGAR